jgi:hypothetical protein
VDIIFFINFNTQKYILFANNKSYIVAKSTTSVAFYEPYLLTNIEFNTQYKKRKQSKNKQTKKDYVKDLFKVNMRKLKDLEFKKEALEKLIQKEKKKLESIGQGKLDL